MDQLHWLGNLEMKEEEGLPIKNGYMVGQSVAGC